MSNVGVDKKPLVALVIVMLASVEPLTHLWVHHCPPEGTVPTGMHIGDSGHHLLSMRSFDNGFFSPFATCRAVHGDHYFGYFAVPIFLLYGVAGEIGRVLHLDEFLYLGLLNGLGGLLYLIAAYRLLRRISPRHGENAFLLFALGGGLGGVLYVATGLLGWHTHPRFEQDFLRFAWYELIEGQHLSPLLLMPRFYYTFPLALGLSALTALIDTDRAGGRVRWMLPCLLMMLATFINARLGPMLGFIAVLYLADASPRDLRTKIREAAALAVAVGAGGAAAWAVLRWHPVYTANVSQVTQQVIRLLPLLYATLFFWPGAWPALRKDLGELRPLLRYPACALGGYLLAYAALYAAYQAYYGNWLHGGDTIAAARVSDPALLGAVPGLAAAFLLRKKRRAAMPACGSGTHCAVPCWAGYQEASSAWLTLWLLAFLAAGLSANGGGALLRFSPERCIVLVGLPLSLLAARGLAAMAPRRARFLYATLLVCGMLSLGVASLCFQGPLGATPGKGPFAYLHYELMTAHDAQLLEELPDGTVAVPLWSPIAFGEIVALKKGVRVLGGPGALNIGDQPFGRLESALARFFAADADDEFRREFVREWCVKHIYCPDTCPLEPAILEQLRALPWLREFARAGAGCLFEVL